VRHRRTHQIYLLPLVISVDAGYYRKKNKALLQGLYVFCLVADVLGLMQIHGSIATLDHPSIKAATAILDL
jgi:hypothetical protein